MKNTIKVLLLTLGIIVATIAAASAQSKIDEERMQRDIEVAENVLSTLMRQQISKRNYFPMEVQGSYLPGFGVTFRLPSDYAGSMFYMLNGSGGDTFVGSWGGGDVVTVNGVTAGNSSDEDDCLDCPANASVQRSKSRSVAPRAKSYKKMPLQKKNGNDSLKNAYNQAIVQASKDFIADYGDMMSQLGPDERIVITNRSEAPRNMFIYGQKAGGIYLTMEATRSDITLFKQGKLTRDQFMGKIKTVNSETSDDLSPDLELLSSIFNRLYRTDLSKTYFIQEDIYYERLKDFGVIYDMHAYSSNVILENYIQGSNGNVAVKRYSMPTLGIDDVDKEGRNKKVKEIYPAFEKGIIDDVLEYGKTIKSLKDNETVIFNIQLTECKGCGIPSTLEISFKESVLKDYSSGKLTKDAALAKVTLKKGADQ